MKKKLALCLALVFVLAMFGAAIAACDPTPAGLTDEQLTSLLAEVRNYHISDDEVTNSNYSLIAKVFIVGDKQEIVVDVQWISSSDKVTIASQPTSTGFYKVTVPAGSSLESDLSYTLTATLIDGEGNPYKNEDGATYSITFNRKVEAEKTEEQILAALKQLEKNTTLAGGPYTMTGAIKTIDTPYDSGYKNITVTIEVCAEKFALMCYRLKGGEDLAVGDTIKVTGNLKNYNGTLEFDAGCTFELVKKGEGGHKELSEAEILTALKALAVGATLEGGPHTLTGTIKTIDTEYSEQYKNITVTIEVGAEKLAIQCFRLKGGEELAVGDTITVTGNLINYANADGTGKLEFNSGCTYTKDGGSGTKLPELGTAAAIIDLTANHCQGDGNSKTVTLNGITVTNEKGASTSAVVVQESYADRFYKSSDLKIEYTAAMTAIKIVCDDYNNGQYTTGLDGLTIAGATITRDGAIIVVQFDTATTSFVVTGLTSQLRVNSIEVYTAQ